MENIKDPDDLLKAMKRIGYKKDLGITPKVFEDVKYNLEEEIKRQTFVKTAGYKKVENYVKDMARRPKFYEFLKYSRKKFGIPEKGFDYSTVEKKQDDKTTKIWNSDEFWEYLDKFVGKHKIPGLREFIGSYIFYNDTMLVSNEINIPIIRVVDISLLSGKKTDALALEAEKNLPSKAKGKLSANAIAQIGKFGQLMSYAETYPIAILLHPYMSQRDIVDAVKNTYKTHIEPLQKELRKEGIDLGIIRKKSKRAEERNKFIYENRTLGIAKLRTAIREKYHDILDESYIYKIIKEERLKNK